MSRYVSRALVDWSGFGKTIGDVQGGFSLLEFLDYCTVLEGVILYDELVPVGARIKDKWETEINLLQAAGVLSNEEVKSTPADVGPRPDDRARFRYSRVNVNIARSSLVDSWYETGRLIGAEKVTGISTLPMLRQRSMYEKYALIKEEHTFCNLIAQHKDLSHALQELRRNARLSMAPYYIAPIPPVPLMVLERSTRKEDFLKNALEIRDEFSSLRLALTELRELLDSPDASLAEKIKYRYSWEKVWGTLGKYKDSPYSFDLADASKDKISIERSFDGIGLDSLALTKIVEKAISEASELFRRKRIRMLHKAAKNYITSSDGHINRQIIRFYNCEVNEKDFEHLKQYGIELNINV
jgi:hypothetical protein